MSVYAAPVAPVAYPEPMKDWLRSRLGGEGPRLALAQSLGAFPRPGEGISPLYVFFEVTNAGREGVEVVRASVGVRGEARPVYEGPFLGGPLPNKLEPGESLRIWTRAKTLAGSLKSAGHGGRPRALLVVEDIDGHVIVKPFRFRVDEYLELKDE